MINVSTAVATNYNNIDLENSILILGAADTNYKENIITKFNSLLEVEDCYGDNSDLTLAYKEACFSVMINCDILSLNILL